LRAVILLALALGCVACDKPEAETVATPVTMEGTPSPKLVGTWDLKAGGKSTIDLNSDGTSRIVAEAPSPGGTVKTDVAGKWTEKDGKLFMRRKGPDGSDFTIAYDYALDPAGEELKLSLPGRRVVQTYRKQKS
jgi:hypothetical protein